MTKYTGGCLCGDVSYEVDGPLRDISYCHCIQCRKTSGHYVAATAADLDTLNITRDEGLTWYRSSDSAERGFCRRCGSSVFWAPSHGRYMAIMAGTLDSPTGLKSQEHIWVDYKSDYYNLDDGLPRFPESHADLWEEEGT
jgi:hypothetical protein